MNMNKSLTLTDKLYTTFSVSYALEAFEALYYSSMQHIKLMKIHETEAKPHEHTCIPNDA